jgi:DNA repair exonuclease SbcCD nuclease subunit
MTFTFVHTADWQIGKPFGNYPDDVAALLREARLDAINGTAKVAQDARVRHVLVAGDVFDSAMASDKVIAQVLFRLQSQNEILWHLLPGNHDPCQSSRLWERIATQRLPTNVRLHLTPTAHELEPGIILLPAPVTAKAMNDDPTRWMDDHRTALGTIRIGVAHGSVQGFGSEGEAQIPISPSRPQQAGLAYLALGDWHGTKRITDRVWYSGTPEPDQFNDNDPGNVLVVQIADANAVPVVTPIATRTHTWLRRHIEMTERNGLAPLLREIAELGANAQRTLLQLQITGILGVAEAAELNEATAALEGQLRYLKVDQSGLRFTARDLDLASIGSGAITQVAQRLQRDIEGGSTNATTAERALGILARYAAVADRSS